MTEQHYKLRVVAHEHDKYDILFFSLGFLGIVLLINLYYIKRNKRKNPWKNVASEVPFLNVTGYDKKFVCIFVVYL